MPATSIMPAPAMAGGLAARPRADSARRIRELIEGEKEMTSSPASGQRYARQHARRFDITFDFCRRLVPDTNAVVCDVGRSSFTERLAAHYADVWSLGFGLHLDDGGHREQNEIGNTQHILFNLNASREVSLWPNVGAEFDLIVCAETIEHLYTPPEFAFLMLASLLKPGGLLLVTTPNASGITRRIQLLLGYHPFERIRYYSRNPGHFREYTRREMVEMGWKVGLEVRECRTVNFYRSRRMIVECLKYPAAFRDSLVAVYAAPQIPTRSVRTGR
jgi:2-polyprenyl-3-methyl-5-hydroxy-6-metoxy-1,4-benzoquinol methylase